MNQIRTIGTLTLLVATMVSMATAEARPRRSTSSWRTLNAQAQKARTGTSNKNLARVLMKIRRLPGGVKDLKAAYKTALTTSTKGTAKADLRSYLDVRGNTAGFLAKTLGKGMVSDRKGPAAKFMIAGQFRASRVTDTVVDPATGKAVAKVYASSKKDVVEAISKAHQARKQTASLSPAARAEILRSVAKQIKTRRHELAQVMSLESGKPLADALVECDRAVNTFRLAAREALKLKPRTQNTPDGKMRVERTPIGVISAITPFNFPLNLVAHKLAPSIAAGNPIVIKPSQRTPMTSLLLAEMVTKTAWPKGAISVVTPRLSNIAPLVKDKRIRMVSFTGSEKVGWAIKKQASDKRVALELGGNAALVVHKDADLADAVKKAVRGSFAYSGQICISTQRIMVHDSLYPKFIKEFVKQTKQIKMGDPLAKKSQIGPMIDGAAARRTQAWVAEARAGGAKVLTGGKIVGGNFMQPTVVVGAKATDKIVSEEVFGPVVVISRYKKLNSALKQVNGSRFGLQAGIFTKSQATVNRAYKALDVGGLVVNHVPTIRFDSQPYGGNKSSGYGREGPKYTVQEMTEYKALLMPGVK